MYWYFYNAPYDIDRRETSSTSILNAGVIDSSFIRCSPFTLVSPNPAWKPFNPGDNYRIETLSDTPVGYRRELFKVSDMRLTPIYWNLDVSVPIRRTRFIFTCSWTPLLPEWDKLAQNLYRIVQPWSDQYQSRFTRAKETLNLDDISTPIFINKIRCKLFFTPGKAGEQKGYILSLHQSQSLQFLKNLEAKLSQAVEISFFNYEEYKKAHNVLDSPSDDISYEPPPISHLSLVVHGIGQHNTSPSEPRNFNYVVDRLRERVLKVQGEEQCRTLMLPIVWRSGFNIQNDHFSLPSIIPPFAADFRERAYDFFNDVPYYMGPHRELMIKAVTDEINRTFKIFQQYHSEFTGNIHLIGHSLGATIVADILSTQPTDCTMQAYPPLPFNVENFYTLGSPLGLFLYLRNAQLLPRSRLDGPLPTFGCLAVQQVFNIIHPFDMVASLLGPTVVGGSIGLVPAKLPEPLQQPKRKWRAFPAPEDPVAVGKPKARNENVWALNSSGQLDWILSSPHRFDILSAISAHTSYWVSQDFAKFLVETAYSKSGSRC